MGRRAADELPRMRQHVSGNYYVKLWVRGKLKQIYLGKNRAAAKKKFDELVVKSIEEANRLPDPDEATVADMIATFLDYAEERYQKHGRSTGTYSFLPYPASDTIVSTSAGYPCVT